MSDSKNSQLPIPTAIKTTAITAMIIGKANFFLADTLCPHTEQNTPPFFNSDLQFGHFIFFILLI